MCSFLGLSVLSIQLLTREQRQILTVIYGKSLAIVPLSIYPNEGLAYLEITAARRYFVVKGKIH